MSDTLPPLCAYCKAVGIACPTDCGHADQLRAYAEEAGALDAEIEALREANEKFGMHQEWWNERMFVLEQERDHLRAIVKMGRDVYSQYGVIATTPDHGMYSPEGNRLLIDWLSKTDEYLRRLELGASDAS